MEGLGLAIATSTPRANAELVLEGLGLADDFAAIVSGEAVTRGKPDPEGFLLAARRLGVEAVGCVVLEDAPAGIEAARAAGMGSVGVTTSHPAKMLREADLVVKRLDDPRLLSFLLA
jgi:HAD superfamily hydrolase (TIGR01509 family)